MDHISKETENKNPCSWSRSSQQLLDYHNNEWGHPVKDEYKLFEKISLESFQSGLSWSTILAKRKNFRSAFCNFNFNEIAKFDHVKVNLLLENKGIIRHKGKIQAIINNAQKTIEIVKNNGSFAKFVWKYHVKNKVDAQKINTISTEAFLMCKDLKKLGWKFIGPTTIYAFMQASGIVNDHATTCLTRDVVTEKLRNFRYPK